MSEANDLTVAERMRSMFAQMTRAERQLANAMLESYPVLGLDSITAVASASGVSTPTVVRMAKKLGYRGFPEMQAALRAELEATISNPIAKHDRWTGDGPDTHMLNRFADKVSDNLRRTLRQLSLETFDAVVALLSDRDRAIHLVGGRISRSMAEYMFTHLQVIRPGVRLIAPNANTWPHYVLDIAPGDLLIVFDVRRYEQELLRLAEMARDRGALIVLFTDQWGSPVSKLATHAFHARIEAPSAWDSSVVTLFVAEAVIAAVQDSGWAETSARMRSLEELFDQTRMFRKFV
jgi:DNA-binding MurR/RpiR family transcriptional regulator